jgi:hypothetical protein
MLSQVSFKNWVGNSGNSGLDIKMITDYDVKIKKKNWIRRFVNNFWWYLKLMFNLVVIWCTLMFSGRGTLLRALILLKNYLSSLYLYIISYCITL